MRAAFFLFIATFLLFLYGATLTKVHFGEFRNGNDFQVPIIPSFQKRIDSLEPFIYRYHGLLQQKQQLNAEGLNLRMKRDSILLSMKKQMDLLQRMMDTFTVDTGMLTKTLRSSNYPKAREIFLSGLIDKYALFLDAGKKLDQFTQRYIPVDAASDPLLAREQKNLFDAKQQHLSSFLNYASGISGKRAAGLYLDDGYGNMMVQLEKYLSIESSLKNLQQQLVVNDRQLDSLSDIKVSPPEVFRSGNFIFKEFLTAASGTALHRFRFHQNNYVLCLADADEIAIRIHPNTTGRLQTLGRIWKPLVKAGKHPHMVVNGGMYERDGTPVGLLIADGKKWKRLETHDAPLPDNFHLYPNGVFYVDKHDKAFVAQSKTFSALTPGQVKNIRYATQSGPLLLFNDTIHPSFRLGSSSLHIRNGVGVLEGSGRKMIAFVISESRVNFFDLALVYKYILNCKNALYLDGSVSRMYYTDKKGNVLFGDLKGDLGPVISVSSR